MLSSEPSSTTESSDPLSECRCEWQRRDFHYSPPYDGAHRLAHTGSNALLGGTTGHG